MPICNYCGGNIEFRYIGGRPIPVHPSGGCQSRYTSPISLSSPVTIPKVSNTPKASVARTYKTICRWCGDEVYYHTNGYGDSVLFDSLGSPWEVHGCWEQYRDQKKNIKLFDLKVQDFKCLVLAGAIRKIQKERLIPTEINVAVEMGISIEELQLYYGSLYVLVSNTNRRIVLAQEF